jgi:hypothetical protein
MGVLSAPRSDGCDPVGATLAWLCDGDMGEMTTPLSLSPSEASSTNGAWYSVMVAARQHGSAA